MVVVYLGTVLSRFFFKRSIQYSYEHFYSYTYTLILAEVPGFARGIPRTIKYKCAIIAHHERKAGEMPIIAHHERKAGEMPILSVFMTKRCTIFTSINQ